MIIPAKACLIFFLVSVNVLAAGQNVSPISKPTLTSPEAAPTQPVIAEPRITSVTASSCIRLGDSITIAGRDFGSRSGVALGGNGTYIALAPTYWSSTKIIAKLPFDSGAKTGEQYFVTIKSTTSGAWLGSSNKYVRICELNAPDTAAPGAPASAPPQETSSHPAGSEPEATGFGSMSLLTGGSLMSRELPAVPQNLASSETLAKDQFEPNELIVISNDMAQARALAEQLGAYGLRTTKRTNLKNLGLVISTFQAAEEIDLQQTAINIRNAYPSMWADVNHRYELLGDSRSTQPAKKLVKWNDGVEGCGKGLRIGLIDTEVDTTHPALREQNITAHSIVTHGIKTGATDHGTAIATLLVGDHQSAAFSGLLPSAELYSASVFRQRGENNIDTTAEWLVNAIDWLISQNVQVINMSVGGPPNLLVTAAIQRTIESGIPVIAAAGNGGPDASEVFPAAQEGVIAVTAVDSKLKSYKKSNQGEYIDFAAPGVDIWAGNDKGAGKFYSGTSFAVPFVTAGMARLLAEEDAKAAYLRLQTNAADLGPSGKDSKFGWGLIQIDDACN